LVPTGGKEGWDLDGCVGLMVCAVTEKKEKMKKKSEKIRKIL